MSLSRQPLALLLGAATCLGALPAQADLDAELGVQLRLFPQDGPRAMEASDDLSSSFSAEWYWESEDRNTSLTVLPFARFGVEDQGRDHFDVREFALTHVFGDFELRAGISKVFWGKTEINHLVDVINQDDNLENLDGEDKLGQPMLRLSYRVPGGQLVGFVLPGFREREFVGPEARLSTPLKVRQSGAIYESSEEEDHVDWALRWEGYVGSLDFGLAHFSGTARDPQLVPNDFQQPTALLPVYAQMEQTSLDAQYIHGGWLFKLEALSRDSAVLRPGPQGLPIFVDERFAAATGGFEYTLYGVMGSAADLGLLAEYLWDERGESAPTPFQNDLFLGGRLALNDIPGTTLLGGAVVDLDNDGAFINIEASRRLGSDYALSIEARVFSNVDPRDTTLYPVRNDDYLQLELTRYF